MIDFGSTFTKLVAVDTEKEDIIATASHFTTVSDDITIGYQNALKALYEKIRKRPVFSSLNRLHYNPTRWWTWFSDIFAVCLLIITVTGLFMIKGPKGMIGRGGIEFLIGILIPLLFILL